MHKETLRQEMEKLNYKLDNLKVLLMGNGKMGIAEMARRAFEYTQLLKKTKQGYLDWMFRIIIAILLGFIAVKVGLK